MIRRRSSPVTATGRPWFGYFLLAFTLVMAAIAVVGTAYAFGTFLLMLVGQR